MTSKKTPRQLLAGVDKKIISLLEERERIIATVRTAASRKKTSVPPPLSTLSAVTSKTLSRASMQQVFGEIEAVTRAERTTAPIAYLGPEATFNHLAVLRRFGKKANTLPVAGISMIFKMVENGSAAYGVVPIENSTEGVVTHALDMFLDTHCVIIGELFLPIHLNLISREKDTSRIKKVYSHPQPLAQCRLWLENNIPGAQLIESSSTAAAVQLIRHKKGAAAIANEIAAETYAVPIRNKNIEDCTNNLTRFLIIAPHMTAMPKTGKDKTSVVCLVKRSTKSGSLHRLLTPLAKNKVNMTKIESRPSRKKVWEYMFYIDMLGHYQQPIIARTLRAMERECSLLKILGSYPYGTHD